MVVNRICLFLPPGEGGMRKLKAIEIAEGALLADLAAIFQLMVIYIPFVGSYFRVLIFTVFTILALRRGLYVGVMGMFVALFITSVTIGPQYSISISLAAVGGLFLGITMKYRLRHSILLLLGVTSGALLLYCLNFFFLLLSALSPADYVQILQQIYKANISVIEAIFAKIGLISLWKQSIYPQTEGLAAWGFTYWWASFYLALWVMLWPTIIIIYTFTNIFVRLLGYDVRPFPDGKLNKLLVKIRIKRSLRRRQKAML
jgi:hypothetical protein